jgi:hypothetical protein
MADRRRQRVTSLDGTMVTGNGIAARYSSSPGGHVGYPVLDLADVDTDAG